MKWLKNSSAIILNAISAACCGRDKRHAYSTWIWISFGLDSK